MVGFCTEDAHTLNKRRGQLLMARNDLFPAPSETETKGVLGKKIILHKRYWLFYKQKALLVFWCVSLRECLLETRQDFWKQPRSWWFSISWFRIQWLLKESCGAARLQQQRSLTPASSLRQSESSNKGKMSTSSSFSAAVQCWMRCSTFAFRKTGPHPKAQRVMNHPLAGHLRGESKVLLPEPTPPAAIPAPLTRTRTRFWKRPFI